jgi:XRE family transcriptional regulator, aerobic/anaerobic benzoate catabolism transcriptional regulator
MPRAIKPRRRAAVRNAAHVRNIAKGRRTEPQDVAYLRSLAEKIRYARAQRGMTRSALAADSGVSLRFLAQLESGEGNPSVLVLRRIAAAMGFPPDALLSGEPPRPIDHTLAGQLLSRLSDHDLVKARRLLTQHFRLDTAREAKKHYVTLIGLRGAGKKAAKRGR